MPRSSSKAAPTRSSAIGSTQQGEELRARLEKLNDARKEVFGSIDTELLGTERLDHAAQLRRRATWWPIDHRFIFGYNVVFGLKTETNLEDVFCRSTSSPSGKFQAEPIWTLIGDERFVRDFKEIYRYYKARHVRQVLHGRPAPVHGLSHRQERPTDIKTFKWLRRRDDRLEYVDNRSDHEVRFPPQHEFEWIRTTRDLHRVRHAPAHLDRGSRLRRDGRRRPDRSRSRTTPTAGEGIYAEPVDNTDQTLDDAEIYYAIVGNLILLKIRPYQEKAFRYLVFNEKLQTCMRLDSIEHACVLLPDDHGLIFSNGYYLQTGECKTFESELSDMLFERRIASPNGEDFLYVFYNRAAGVYVLLQYNLIEQKVETPLVCNGYTLFDGGELVCFRAADGTPEAPRGADLADPLRERRFHARHEDRLVPLQDRQPRHRARHGRMPPRSSA